MDSACRDHHSVTLPLPDTVTRLGYLGTPELAAPTLEALLDAGYVVPLVVTRPDVRRGRRGEPAPSPVKVAALRRGLAVSHDVDDLLEADVDLVVVVAYGRLIKPHVLARLPMVNLHFSLLPRWRGAAPVERALLAGDEVTGVCVMDVVDELDAGDVFSRSEVRIGPTDTLESLRATLVDEGTRLLLAGLRSGFGPGVTQHGDVTYAAKLSAADLNLDWTTSVVRLDRQIRVGGAWTTFRGKRLKIWQAQPFTDGDTRRGAGGLHLPEASGDRTGPIVTAGDGTLELKSVQPEGKARMDAHAWANGAHLGADDRLGT